jgi:Flp pilus assembly protein TadD
LQKRYNDGEVYFRQALSRDPNSLEAVKGMVSIDLAKNRPADALKFLQEQISRNPNAPGLYLVQGEIQLQAKQLEQAETAFSRSVELDHTNAGALAILAQTRSSLGKNDLAIQDYQKAIELSPRDPHLYVGLGTIYERSGDWQRAEENYQKTLSLQPENPLAANNLAYLLLEHNGDVTVALSLAQTARKGLPKLPNSADTLAWAYYRNGAFSAALPLLEDAVKKVPGSLVFRYHLGLTYQKLNETAQARTQFDKIIGTDPKSPLAEQARQALNSISSH